MKKNYIDKGLNGEFAELNMDTRNEKEGLHIWITTWIREQSKGKASELVMDTNSIHLNREQCRQLRDEINERLF